MRFVKIIHRQDVPASAELLAGCIGRREGFRLHLRPGADGAWRAGTLHPERPFWVEPDEIKRLAQGEAVVLVKHPAFQVRRVRIKRAGGGGYHAPGLAG